MSCCGDGLCMVFKKNKPRQKSMIRVIKKNTDMMSMDFILVNNGRDVTESYNVTTSLIGEGGFGSVRQVTEKRTGSVLVMKSMLKSAIPDVKLFQNEISFQSMCDHPHICRLHETFEDQKMVYVIMEPCDGGEVLDLIDKQGCFGELDAWHIFQQLIKALFYLHTKVLIAHRDLKPENFLLKEKGLPINQSTMKLIDFGFAMKFEPGMASLHTKLGTPFYMCPEIMSGNYDEKCDVWSSGVILYLMLSGDLPFYSEDTMEILEQAKQGYLPFKEEAWGNVSPSAQSLIREMCSLDPEKRPSAAEVANSPWLQQTREEVMKVFQPCCRTRSTSEVARNLHRYAHMNSFKKVALAAVARVLEDKDVGDLRETFEELDVEGDGTISVCEMKKVLLKSGVPEKNVSEMCQSVAVKGEITYSTFLSANVMREDYQKEAYLWDAFRMFDRDGNGQIDLNEFKMMISHHCTDLHMTHEQVEDLFRKYDTSCDMQVDFDEFMAAMREVDEAPQPSFLSKCKTAPVVS